MERTIMQHLPLLGTRVLDLTRLAPGPFATLVLLDLGAEVIKVEEPIYGDSLRYAVSAEADSRPTLFALLNRGKKSVTLNLKTEEGKGLFRQLVRGADVLVEGFRPGVMRRLGLDYESLQPFNSGLVFASLSGYGQSGPYRRRACHDVNCLALAGLLHLTGSEDGAPALSAVPWADMVAGLWTAMAVAAALLGRARTGAGQYLDMSMLDSVFALMHVPLADWLNTQVPPQPGKTSLGGRLACYNVYETSDGRHMSLGALEPHFWEAFCLAAGREDWIARHYERDQVSLRTEVAALFRSRPQSHWMGLFEVRDCCCEPVLRLDEAITHPQMMHRGLLREGHLATPLAGLDMPDAPAPQLGEYTAQILAELGYTVEDVQRLRQSGVV